MTGTVRMHVRKMFIASLVLAVAAGTAAAQPPVSASPPAPMEFSMMAAQADQYEITAARVAQIEALDPQVKQFASQMLTEHTQTSKALREAAAASKLPPPPQTMSTDQSAMLSALQSARGREFDKAYMRQQVLAHTQALTVQEIYASAGADANLRQAANAAIPLIRHHLEMAQTISKNLDLS